MGRIVARIECATCAQRQFEKLAGALISGLHAESELNIRVPAMGALHPVRSIEWRTFSGSCEFRLALSESGLSLILKGSLIGGLISLQDTLGRHVARDFDTVEIESSNASALEDFMLGRITSTEVDTARDQIHNSN